MVKTMCQDSGIEWESKKDEVNHPVHYNSSSAHCECGRRIECIDVAREFDFALGNVIKYIWRAEHKHNFLNNLLKAQWYLNDEINRLKKMEK